MRKAVLRWLVSLLLVGSALTGISFAQNEPVRFGQVTKADFDLIQSLADTSAEAYVLHDFGETIFFIKGDDLWMEQLVHERIYIRKKSAYSRATVQRPIYAGRTGQELLLDIRGVTHNLVNGEIVSDKMSRDAIFTEKLCDNVQQKKFTLPNVREGSIIEYSYKKQTPFSLEHNPSTWFFQSSVPVRWSEYRISIPTYYYYKMIMGGYLPLHLQESKPTRIGLSAGLSVEGTQYRFVVKDAPAFRDEPYITTELDYLSRVEFELANINIPGQLTRDFSLSWQALDKTLLDNENFGGQLGRISFMKEVVARAKAKPDTFERLTSIYSFVRSSLKWNGRAQLYSGGSKKVWDAGEGDAADINLILVAALREAGFEANPVILSTRTHGKINEAFARINKFNYVVAHVEVNGREMLLDATDRSLKPGMLPFHCLNGDGRLIHPSAGRFVSLNPSERDTELETIKMELASDGELTGSFTKSHGGYSAWRQRNEIAAEGQDKYLEAVRKDHKGWQISKSEVRNLAEIEQSVIVEHTVTIPDAGQVAGDRIYFRPLLSEAYTENPFKATERSFPVDFGAPMDETFMAEYKLPAGYEAEQLPSALALTLPNNGGRYNFQASVRSGTLVIISRLNLRLPQYSAEEYHNLREFFARIVAKQAEQVVLKKQLTASK